MDSLNLAYIVCTFILSQSDFKIVLFGIFPVFQAAQVILNIQGQKNHQNLIKKLPQEYWQQLPPFDTFQKIKNSFFMGSLVLIALYL